MGSKFDSNEIKSKNEEHVSFSDEGVFHQISKDREVY